MGKLAGRPRAALPHSSPRLALRLAPLAVAAMLLASECRADWKIYPTIGVTQTYTDNVSYRPHGQEEPQFVTELNPGVTISGSGRRYKVAASSQWRHFEYTKDLPGTADNVHEYGFSGQGVLAEDLLFIDASAGSSPQTVSAFGPQLGNNLYSLGNRTKIKTWSIAPYLDKRFSNDARVLVRYVRDSVDAGETNLFGSSLGDSLSANLDSGSIFKAFGLGLNYARQDLENKQTGESSSETVAASLRYALNRRFALTSSVGYDRYDFEGPGGNSAGRNWSVGFNWSPSLRTKLSTAIGRHFYGQTGKLDASHRSRYTTWSILYDDGITNTRSQFLLPAAIDTSALLDRLFASTISDPVLRQQAVANYIRTSGLPPSLAESVNYLSNRYVRQKQLQASMAYDRGRSGLIVSAFRSERIALSNQQSDSPLLGTELSALNDNVRQKGASMNYTYRLNSRTSALASFLLTRSHSLETGYDDTGRQIRVGLTRRLGNKLSAGAEFRHMRGGIGINAGTYRENAISATLSAQL
jgi:uncharacterized protein (PEP-CTERM system associated)